MAFFMGTVYSKELLQDTSFHVILPHDGRRYEGKGNPKTLILLHGLSDSAATWVRRTSIERYAERYDLAVIMPEVHRSWYQDMVYGINAYKFITEEVLNLAANMFHVSTKKEDVLIAGLSMGGYGALRCALENPEKFGYCGAFSGAYDLKQLIQIASSPDGKDLLAGMVEDYGAIFGEKTQIPKEVTVKHIIKNAGDLKERLPKVYMMCGTEDILYPQTCEAKKLCETYLKEFIYEEWSGHHEWDMWDTAIEKMLQYFLGHGRRDFE
ncbi:MAG: alpha/beta hydrolase family protein [Eubacteriales bacterium]|nr:alpha/beta hydrolase family protein [Eubacteriales bacterium]